MSTLTAPLAERDDDVRMADPEHDFEHLLRAAAQRPALDHSHALRLLYSADDARPINLPILATAGDVREVVQYLKKKPAGVSVVEAMDDVKRRVFEPRKIAAYEFWGIVERQGGDRLLLSQLGWEFARKLEPETEAYRTVLTNAMPYRSALEWIHREHQELVTHTEVAAYWQQLFAVGAGQNQKTVESSVVCFFHLCQAAEIGTMTIGKRGQPARLRVEREELDRFIEGRAPDSITSTLLPALETANFRRSLPAASALGKSARAEGQGTCLLLSCRTNTNFVNKLQTMLGLLDIETHTFINSETAALPVSEEMFQAMRRCDAAIIVVSPDDYLEDGLGGYTLKQHILIEINTAFVLYDRRVVLLWNSRVPSPDNLISLPHFIYEDDDLTWDEGVRLLHLLKEFQEGARRQKQASHCAGSNSAR